MSDVLYSFPHVFSDIPGLTRLVQCDIKLNDQSPCRKAAYRVPYALQEKVESQLIELMKIEIVRESDYSRPLVVVRKKG